MALQNVEFASTDSFINYELSKLRKSSQASSFSKSAELENPSTAKFNW